MYKNLKKFYFIFFSVIIFNFSACVLVPFIDSYKQIGVTEGDRQSLLPKTLKEFQNNIYWGNFTQALSFADEENVGKIKESIQEYQDKKIVSFKMMDAIFMDSAKKAEVTVEVKYYSAPAYVVKEQRVKEVWTFSIGSWTIKERVVLSEK